MIVTAKTYTDPYLPRLVEAIRSDLGAMIGHGAEIISTQIVATDGPFIGIVFFKEPDVQSV